MQPESKYSHAEQQRTTSVSQLLSESVGRLITPG